jgi:hypothetical protein
MEPHPIPPRPWFDKSATAAILLWLILLAAILTTPSLTNSESAGDDLVRNTVRLSLLYYAGAASLIMLMRRDEWVGSSVRGSLARWCWTLAWAAYLVHVGMAFHHAHGWSHEHAVAHTRAVSGVGEGIYVSHLFTLAWTADVLYWWLRPVRYAARPPWVGRLLHGFMVFMIFNATVVFETGWIRWAGAVMFAGLAALWLCGRRKAAAARAEDSIMVS